MPAAAVTALQDHIDDLAADEALDAAERVRDLRSLREDLESLVGIADRYIGDEQLAQEAAAFAREGERIVARENADIRGELLEREMATVAELELAGMWSHDELDRRERDGEVLLEGAFARIDPKKLAAIAAKRRRSMGGQFADEFGSLAAPKKPKGRGGKALPGGTPNTPGGSSAEATGRATAAARAAAPPPSGVGERFIGGGLRNPPKAKLPDKAEVPDEDGFIDVGDDVVKAADLLAQGKKVKLASKRQASTLLTELAKRVQEAKAKGDQAPNFDLCKVTVRDTNLFCAESKGIERVRMPQLMGVPLPGSRAAEYPLNPQGEVDLSEDFRKMLEENGAKVTEDVQKASFMKASQIELNGAKTAGMTAFLEGGGTFDGDPRIFVSHDDYIVDGHHRWAAHVGVDLADGKLGDIEMPVRRVDMDIIELLEAANRYAREMGIPQASVTEGPEEQAAKAAKAPPASPGTEKPKPKAKPVDPQRKKETDDAVRNMFEPGEEELPNQQFATMDDLYAAAEADLPEFEELLTTELPDTIGGRTVDFGEALENSAGNPDFAQVLMGPLKKRARSEEKTEAKFHGDHNQLIDIVRATILVPTAADAPDTLAAVRKRFTDAGWQVKGAKDRFSEEGPPPPSVQGPTDAGYSDMTLALVSPNGTAAELQINTPSMFVAKEGDGHDLYEEQRTIEADQIARRRHFEGQEALRANGENLPEYGPLYFNLDQDELGEKYGEPVGGKKAAVKLTDVPLDKITPVRARPEGIANAEPLMAKAGLDEGGKRDPITLVKGEDGTYTVFDGNSTFAIAQKHGWGKIPAMVVDSEEKAAELEAKANEAKAAAKAAPDPPASPGTKKNRPYPGATADEISRLRVLKEQQQALYGEARMVDYG